MVFAWFRAVYSQNIFETWTGKGLLAVCVGETFVSTNDKQKVIDIYISEGYDPREAYFADSTVKRPNQHCSSEIHKATVLKNFGEFCFVVCPGPMYASSKHDSIQSLFKFEYWNELIKKPGKIVSYRFEGDRVVTYKIFCASVDFVAVNKFNRNFLISSKLIDIDDIDVICFIEELNKKLKARSFYYHPLPPPTQNP